MSNKSDDLLGFEVEYNTGWHSIFWHDCPRKCTQTMFILILKESRMFCFHLQNSLALTPKLE